MPIGGTAVAIGVGEAAAAAGAAEIAGGVLASEVVGGTLAGEVGGGLLAGEAGAGLLGGEIAAEGVPFLTGAAAGDTLAAGDALATGLEGPSLGSFGGSASGPASGGLTGLFGLSPSDLMLVQAGGSLLSGLTGAATNLTAGNKIQAAGNTAAGNSAAAGQRAVSDSLRIAGQTREDLLPFQALGLNAGSALAPLVGINAGGNPLTAALTKPFTAADLENTPGYQFTKTQGLQGVQNSAAAQGLGTSGAALKGAANFTTGLAQTTYNQQLTNYLTQNRQIFDMLNSLVSGGQNAAAATGQIGTQGTLGAGQLGIGSTGQAGTFSTGGAQGAAGGILGAGNALGAGIQGAGNALALPSYINLVNGMRNGNPITASPNAPSPSPVVIGPSGETTDGVGTTLSQNTNLLQMAA